MKNSITSLKSLLATMAIVLISTASFAQIQWIDLSGRLVTPSAGGLVGVPFDTVYVMGDSSLGVNPLQTLGTDSMGYFTTFRLPYNANQGVRRNYTLLAKKCNGGYVNTNVSSTGGAITGVVLNVCPPPVQAQRWIFGTVKAGGTVQSDYTAAVFQLGTNVLYSQNVTSGPAGFHFPNLLTGSYIVWASLNSTNPLSATYIPSFASNSTTWSGANVIQISAGRDSSYVEINLVNSDSSTGNGAVAGTVTGVGGQTNATARTAYSVTFDHRFATVVLKNVVSQKDVYATRLNSNGTYSIGSLPYGTYDVRLEYPKVTAAIATITISAANPSATVNYSVSTSGVTTRIANTLANSSNLSVYPNPAKDVVKVKALDGELSAVKVYNTLGREVNVANTLTAEGADLNISSLAKGVYTIIANTTTNQALTFKLIKD